jgi:hydrogenase expression/formation protein HypC
MCLAIPGKLLTIGPDAHGVLMGKANFGGIVKEVCLQYTPDAVPGEYVLVHVGFALGKIDEAEAQRTFQLLEEMGQLEELDSPSPSQPDFASTAETVAGG